MSFSTFGLILILSVILLISNFYAKAGFDHGRTGPESVRRFRSKLGFASNGCLWERTIDRLLFRVKERMSIKSLILEERSHVQIDH